VEEEVEEEGGVVSFSSLIVPFNISRVSRTSVGISSSMVSCLQSKELCLFAATLLGSLGEKAEEPPPDKTEFESTEPFDPDEAELVGVETGEGHPLLMLLKLFDGEPLELTELELELLTTLIDEEKALSLSCAVILIFTGFKQSSLSFLSCSSLSLSSLLMAPSILGSESRFMTLSIFLKYR
jgi:hypothetical protein